MTRIGIVGAGAIAGVHLDAWRQMPGVEIVGYYDINPAASQRAADRFGGRVYPTQAALMADVDMIDICSPAAAHKENVLAGAAAGCAMICEKPLARHLKDAEEMVAACAQAGVPLYVAHVVRFFAEYAKAQEVVASGAIGKPGVIRTVRAGSFPRAGKVFTSNFYGDFALSGGVILDLAIHDIDYQHWIGGEVERVYAQGLTFSGLQDCDHSLIVLRFASGAVGHIEGSLGAPGRRLAHPPGDRRRRRPHRVGCPRHAARCWPTWPVTLAAPSA